MFTYKTKGTCSREIQFTVEDSKVKNIKFVGGCPGNTVGVAMLANGRSVDEVIMLLEGIPCQNRGTSCPDQFAKALKLYKEQH